MTTPSVVVTVQRNPKHATVQSSVLMQGVQQVTEGAWNTYLGLSPSEQRWLQKIAINVTLMDDGTTPVELEIELHPSPLNAPWSEENVIRLTINQLAGKKPPAIANMVQSYILRGLRKAAEIKLDSKLKDVEEIRAAIARISLQEEPIKRAV